MKEIKVIKAKLAFDVQVSTYCNLKCKFCMANQSTGKNKTLFKSIYKTITENYIVQILGAQMFNNDVYQDNPPNVKRMVAEMEIHLSGGEPILYNGNNDVTELDDFIQKLRKFAKAAGLPIKFYMTTNFIYKLTPEIIDLLVDIDELSTSFDIKYRFTKAEDIITWYKNVKLIQAVRYGEGKSPINLRTILTTEFLKTTEKDILNNSLNLGVKSYLSKTIDIAKGINPEYPLKLTFVPLIVVNRAMNFIRKDTGYKDGVYANNIKSFYFNYIKYLYKVNQDLKTKIKDNTTRLLTTNNFNACFYNSAFIRCINFKGSIVPCLLDPDCDHNMDEYDKRAYTCKYDCNGCGANKDIIEKLGAKIRKVKNIVKKENDITTISMGD